MKTIACTLLASTALVWAPARAQSGEDSVAQEPQPQTADQVTPPSAPPAERPPAPPAEVPPPPGGQQQMAQQSGVAPAGQWVYTAQYGWVWTPNGSLYTREGTAGAYVYVYYPAVGWTWLVAPPAWDWWPWPYYRAYRHGAPWGHRWHGHGWRGYGWRGYGWRGYGWRGYGWHGHPRPWPAPPPHHRHR